jgi:hypothetical protein
MIDIVYKLLNQDNVLAQLLKKHNNLYLMHIIVQWGLEWVII